MEEEKKKADETTAEEQTELEQLKQQNKELTDKLQTAEKSVEDYKDKWMRSVAEFDNYKKRNANLYKDAVIEGKQDVILKVLTVGDNLERALNMELDEKTKEGVSMLLRQFNETMTAQGVTEINPVGEKFDPNVAEAVMQAEADEGEEEGFVKAVFQKGYKLGEKIIRYAKVSVIK